MQFLAVTQSGEHSEAFSHAPCRVPSWFYPQPGGWNHHHLLFCDFDKGSRLPCQSNLDLQSLLKS